MFVANAFPDSPWPRRDDELIGHYREQMTMIDIAAAMGLTFPTIRARVFRLRKSGKMAGIVRDKNLTRRGPKADKIAPPRKQLTPRQEYNKEPLPAYHSLAWAELIALTPSIAEEMGAMRPVTA